MIKIGIIGATGYTGAELIKLLIRHPHVEIAYLTSKSYAGQDINEVYPKFKGIFSHKLVEFDEKSVELAELDLVFLGLPHGISMNIVPKLLEKKIKVVDLGADFRYQDLTVYEKVYGEHAAPDVNKKAVYGLPEFNRDKIKKAELVANPGCYVTAVTIALKPILDKYGVKEGSIIVDVKSGVSGAGRSLTQDTHYPDTNENFSAYKVGVHRHQSEIEQNISAPVLFVPHLLPVNRGIFATCYLTLEEKTTADDIKKVFEKEYKNEAFVKVLDTLPYLKDVEGSNYVQLGFVYLAEEQRLVVVTVLDNLLKGASGQAVQNMNLMLGYEEACALENIAL